MKVLLIGGTGILSTDVTKLCLERNMEVYLVNRGNSNRKIDSRIHVLIANIRDKDQVLQVIGDLHFDVVIDFLSYTPNQLKNTLDIFNNRCDQFIFISSATVYRKTSKDEKITEETELVNDDWIYSKYKIECEELLAKNHKEIGQKYTIIRPYVTYSEKRIPFAMIPKKHWSLANRIIKGKPIVLWDAGQAVCTLTQTKDFAVGIVGLFKNEKAYGQAFHITTDYTLTWREALLDIAKALDCEVKIVDIPSEFILKKIPDLKGELYGDKGLDRAFDNTKIKDAVPDFSAQIKFEDGIKETINYYKQNPGMQKVDYLWDGQMDWLIEQYYKSIGKKDYDKKEISNVKDEKKQSKKEAIEYFLGRHKLYSYGFKIKF